MYCISICCHFSIALSKELPENIQISKITKRLKPQLISVVMLKYPPILDELRQAIVLEQTQAVTQPNFPQWPVLTQS